MKIKLEEGQIAVVSFKYEKLPNFCYNYGCLSHVLWNCIEIWNSTPQYGAWIRFTELRNRGGNNGGSMGGAEEEEDKDSQYIGRFRASRAKETVREQSLEGDFVSEGFRRRGSVEKGQWQEKELSRNDFNNKSGLREGEEAGDSLGLDEAYSGVALRVSSSEGGVIHGGSKAVGMDSTLVEVPITEQRKMLTTSDMVDTTMMVQEKNHNKSTYIKNAEMKNH